MAINLVLGNKETLYFNPSLQVGVALAGHHTNKDPARRDFFAKPSGTVAMGGGKEMDCFVFETANGEQLYAAASNEYCYVAKEGEEENKDPAMRQWVAMANGDGTMVLSLKDGRQMYTNTSGWVGVARENCHSNTDVGRRHWSQQKP
mmetsp:Transcript_47543/g.75197  ORF Transcript_47543/g.75197 Transcript_47543/m.75197 type:complete len:147 (+) Transcript_47543:67-507(+)